MAKFALIATLDVAPGRRDQVLPMLMAHRNRCLKQEPGTLAFEILTPRDDESTLLIYEVYQDDAAFDAHRNGSSVALWRQEAAGLLVDIRMTPCTPVE